MCRAPAGGPILQRMVKRLTASDFRGSVGAVFQVAGLAAPVLLRLETVTPNGAALVPGGREPFSLAFRGPIAPLLPQAIYPLESDAMEPLEIFLVPIGRDEEGHTYEAIFT